MRRAGLGGAGEGGEVTSAGVRGTGGAGGAGWEEPPLIHTRRDFGYWPGRSAR